MMLEQVSQFVKDNWEMLGMGLIFILIPSPATGFYKKFAKKIGLKIGNKNTDSVIKLLDEIKAGLLESKVGDNDSITSNEQIEDILDNAKQKLESKEEDGGNVG